MKCRVIAELGVNHNGDVDVAKDMIRRASGSHADYVKLQFFHVSELELPSVKAKQQLRKVAFNLTQLDELKAFADQQGINWLCTPMKTIRTLTTYVKHFKPSIIKIRELDGRNEAFVNAAVKTGATLLISVDPKKGPYFKPSDKSYLMYCCPKYPPRTADFSHRWAGTYQGFSSHFPHISFCRIAIREARAMGQPMYFVEAHVTLAHDYPCLDRKVSIDFDELAQVSAYGHRER